MSSQRNFLDADKSIMDRNLRFVKNDLEENLNQFFGGSSGRNNNASKTAPPRDYKVVQPRPDGSHAHSKSNDLGNRKEFLIQLGLARHEAYELAKTSSFDVNHVENIYQECVARGYHKDEIRNKVLTIVRNDNNGFGNLVHEEKSTSKNISPIPATLAIYNERDNSNFDHRDNRVRSRSRSNSRPYDAYYRSDKPSSYNRDDEYLSRPRFNSDQERRQEMLIEDDDHKRRLRYQERDFSPMRDRRIEENFSQQRHLRDEAGITSMRKERSRSYSPEKFNNREHFLSRAISPERRLNDFQQNRPFSPLRNQLARSRSPINNKIFKDDLLHSPTRNALREERYQSLHLANKLPTASRENNDAIRNFGGEVSYSRYSMLDNKGTYHRDKSPPELYSQREQSGSRQQLSPRKDSPSHGRYAPSSSTSYEQCDSQHQLSARHNSPPSAINYDQRGSRQQLPPRNSLPSHATSNPFSQEGNNLEAGAHNQISSSIFEDPTQNDPQSSKEKRLDNDIQVFHSRDFPKLLKFKPSFGMKMKRSKKSRNKAKERNNRNDQINLPQLRKSIANVIIIRSGKPKPGFLKGNPQAYWSEWWPHYKYIEYSVLNVDPNGKSCLYYSMDPNTVEACRYKLKLLKKAITKIMKTKEFSEKNYYMLQDIFKLFQYKIHLEDPNFQNTLTPPELNIIAPALRQFQIRTVMAFMHQAIIVKWHLSLEIIQNVLAGKPLKSNHARNLLNNKSFNYLVMESIQELKKMCQQDWPNFTEFYETINATKVDLHALGIGPKFYMETNEDDDSD